MARIWSWQGVKSLNLSSQGSNFFMGESLEEEEEESSRWVS